ncbi:MAG: hypothetical protein QXQ27_03860, partial [Nitrososphaerota archaeon]
MIFIIMRNLLNLFLSFSSFSFDSSFLFFKKNLLYNFNIYFKNKNNIKHNKDLKIYEEGEADQLAEKALKKIGGY